MAAWGLARRRTPCGSRTARLAYWMVRTRSRKSNWEATTSSMRRVWMRPSRGQRVAQARVTVSSKCEQFPERQRDQRAIGPRYLWVQSKDNHAGEETEALSIWVRLTWRLRGGYPRGRRAGRLVSADRTESTWS